MVAKTSELFPEPDSPVKAVSRRLGSSTDTSLRLFSRAPTTRMMSWLSAVASGEVCFDFGTVPLECLLVRSDGFKHDGRLNEHLPVAVIEPNRDWHTLDSVAVTSPFSAGDHPIALAHRGGARERPENSLSAFRHAVNDLGYRYLEIDVRATVDGQVMVFHDATLSRVTDRFGRVSALPYTEVRRAKISGQDTVLRLDTLLSEFPDIYLNVDVKDDHTTSHFVDLVQQLDVAQRLCVGSFSATRTRRLRKALPQAATALTPPEVAALVAASRSGRLGGLPRLGLPNGRVCAQVPVTMNRVPIVTRRFIDAAHRQGYAVHVWTINERQEMHDLLDLGVDGIVTDRPTLLKDVLASRGHDL